MANTNQAKKMVRKIRRRTQHNRWWKSHVSNAIKTMDEIVAEPKSDTIRISEAFSNLQKVIDKASAKGIIHRNRGARLKSKIASRIASLTSTQ